MATRKREGEELVCTAELDVKKTPALSGDAPPWNRVYFGEHKRRESDHSWL